MSTRATSTFTLDSWEPQASDEQHGVSVNRVRITKTFTGDIEGTSTVEMLTAMGLEEGSAAYVAFERISGTVHGRSGSFVLHHTASGSGGDRNGSWSVVPDTGTGELLGLSGTAEIVNEPDGGHTFHLDYELAD